MSWGPSCKWACLKSNFFIYHPSLLLDKFRKVAEKSHIGAKMNNPHWLISQGYIQRKLTYYKYS